MKVNFGCGFNKKEGFLNVDKFATCEPDQVVDLEVFPWPFDSDSVQEALFCHSLEHMGASSDVFLKIMQELYRVCQKDARIQIHVPHPRHDHYIGDPTHVRVITPNVLNLFSKKLNLHWKKIGASNTPLGLYIDVDFEIEGITQMLEDKYLQLLQKGEISEEELLNIVNERNNIVTEYHIILKTIK
jgi:predicted SAM-dependent methyltransferase